MEIITSYKAHRTQLMAMEIRSKPIQAQFKEI